MDRDLVLDNVKEDLDIRDTLQDTILCRLIDMVIEHFIFSYKQDEIENKYRFIIEDCVIKRFNRRGAEGATSESVEGYSVNYETFLNEFAPWDEMLREDFKKEKSKKGQLLIF